MNKGLMVFKKLFLLLTFFSIAPAVCMETQFFMEIEDTVIIQTNDGVDFKVPVDLVQLSGTLYDVIDYAGTDNTIPLPNISATTWGLIRKQLERVYAVKNNIDVAQSRKNIFDAYKNLDGQKLIDLIIAVNYLDIPELLVVTMDIAKKDGMQKISSEQFVQLSKDIRNPIIFQKIIDIT